VRQLFTPLNLAAMVLLAGILVWRVLQLRRAPRSLPLWAVTGTVAFFAVSFLLQQPVAAQAFDRLAGQGTGRLLNNVLLHTGLCALVLFFLGSALGPHRYRRAAFEAIPLLLTVGVLCLAMAITPVELRGAALGPEVVHEPTIALFYLAGGLYLIYCIASCLRWILSYQGTAEPHLRFGLRLGAAGLGCLLAGSVVRALYIVLAWAAGTSVGPLLGFGVVFVIVGVFVFLAGISYPAVRARTAALRRRRAHARRYRGLRPLWSALSEAYPDLVLRAPPSGLLDRLRPRAVHRRYYRRVIEIRDGLVQLSPYLDTDLSALAEEDPRGAARALETALARQAAGETDTHEARLVLPGGNDLDGDVDPLLTLSRAVDFGAR
jgi:hypothetical protein